MLATITGTGNGTAPVVDLTFPFIDKSHVKAAVDGALVTATWTGASQVTFAAPVANGSTWKVYRDTPTNPAIVDFTNGAVLTEADLDLAETSHRYRDEEIKDAQELADAALQDDLQAQINALKTPVNITVSGTRGADWPFQIFTPEQFGAVSNDDTIDNGPALHALGQAVSSAGGGAIYFRTGATYWVGAQVENGSTPNGPYRYAPATAYILEINGTSGGVLLVANGARIKARGGMKFGSYEADGTPSVTIQTDPTKAATPYFAMVYIHDNTGPVTSVGRLELDGNIGAQTIGGQFGDIGWQLPAYGFQIQNNTGAIDLDFWSHHQPLDGGAYDGPGLPASREDARLSLRAHNNGRNGLSVVGGNGLVIKSLTSFGNGKDTNGVTSNPNAGVDFESEGTKYVTNIAVHDADIYDNLGAGVDADAATNTFGIDFYGGRIVGSTNYSLWGHRPRMRFYDVTIMGAMVSTYGSPDPAQAIQFIRCHFNHDPTMSPTGVLYQTSDAAAMWDPGGAGGVQNVLFDTCLIESQVGSPIFGSTPSGPGDDSCHFHNCRFLVGNPSGTEGMAVYGRFSGEKTHFTGINSIPDASFPATHPWCAVAGVALDSYLFENSFAGGGAPVPLTRMNATLSRESMTKLYYGSATFDPPSLAAGAKTPIQTVTVTGAALGDTVEDVSFDQDLAGARIHAWVSAANTVSYYFINENGANPLDLASGTVRVKVRQA